MVRPSWAERHSTLFATLKWAGIGFGALLLLVLALLAFVDGNTLKKPIERFASARSGRAVTISGDLSIHPWSWTPWMVVNGLSIGNPPWEPRKPMAQVERITVRMKWLPLLKGDLILQQVVLEKPRLYLHRERSGRANWTFANTRPSDAPAPPPPDLPVIRDFLIPSGELRIVDEIRKLDFEATLQAHEKASREDPKPFRIDGKGTVNDEPFRLRVAGGALVNLEPDEPYPFDLEMHAGNIQVTSAGSVRKPFDLGRLRFSIHARGSDLADLYYLTQLALPNTPAFRVAADIERNGDHIHVANITGKLGSSDIAGELDVDVSRKRPFLSGNLNSKRLRLKDLSASLGNKAGNTHDLAGPVNAETSSKKADEEPGGVPRLFPKAHLQVERVRGMDADVRFASHSIEAGNVPMKEVAARVKLDSGVLTLQPFALELPQGHLNGSIRIDARKNVPMTDVDVRIQNVQLDQLKGKATGAKPAFGGVLQGRAVLKGSGDSIHSFMANADGVVTTVLPSGEVRAAFAELTGINVARGLGLLLSGDDERVEIRCGLADFAVKEGTMRARKVIFDTDDVLVKGSGEIRLGPEELDLSIKGQPKKLRLLRLRTPVKVNGHLRRPTFGIDAGKTAKQGAVAAALGAAVAPLAAIVAFVDPGLAKDAKCSQLLAGHP